MQCVRRSRRDVGILPRGGNGQNSMVGIVEGVNNIVGGTGMVRLMAIDLLREGPRLHACPQRQRIVGTRGAQQCEGIKGSRFPIVRIGPMPPVHSS